MPLRGNLEIMFSIVDGFALLGDIGHLFCCFHWRGSSKLQREHTFGFFGYLGRFLWDQEILTRENPRWQHR